MSDALRGAAVAALNAILACLQAFGVPITADQQAAAVGAVNALLVAYLVARHQQTKQAQQQAAQADQASQAK